MNNTEEKALSVYERKVLRKLYDDPVKMKNGEYRIRVYHELIHITDGEDIRKYIKPQRLRWAGQVSRIDPLRAQNVIFNA